MALDIGLLAWSECRMIRTSLFTAALTLLLILTVTYLTVGPRVVPGDALSGDKVQHALGFGAIVFPAAVLRPRWLWSLVPAVAIFGGIIEIVQMSVGRDGELADWLADLVGLALATGFGAAVRVAFFRTVSRA
ncbi:teicoplanin resistance protein VanZ [Salipiger thiooxidans]|uniref:teicoplanin resistance protein VanZ n=1 Tax=Salipiger thiooxidans TaxID=282683 RepID=UPI001F5C76CB|nr:teicoplanin resistance protein VanZ [Salipiger thiooxidans]